MARGLRTRLGIGLLSVAGTAAGHYLTYLVAAPHDHSREELLAATGHAGEAPFVVFAIAALLAACVATLVTHRDKASASLPRTVGTLLVLQLLAFVGLEAIERVGAGVDLVQAATEPVLWLGMATQLLVALAGGFIFRALRTAAAATTSRPPLPRFTEVTLVALPALVPPATAPGRTWEARGPPSSS